MPEIPDVIVFVRHSAECKYKGDETYRGCRCRKHLRWSYRGEQFRVSAKTRSWQDAEKAAKRKQDEFGGSGPVDAPSERVTIKKAIESFLVRKTNEEVSKGVHAKYTRELARLRDFASGLGKSFPEQMTLPMLEEFRATWKARYPSSFTRSKVQERLKSFLQYCFDSRWISHIPKLSTIEVSEPETMPLTDAEYSALLNQTYKHFEDYPDSGTKFRALIRLMRFSGLAIQDAVTLKRSEISQNHDKTVYRVVTSRQKNDNHVYVPIPADLAEELLQVANGNKKYVFWSGNGKPETIAKHWSMHFSALFDEAGVKCDGYMKSHRLRDTFAVSLLLKGVSMEDVSRLLGHTSIRTTEKHYAKWNKARQNRIDGLVAQTWEK